MKVDTLDGDGALDVELDEGEEVYIYTDMFSVHVEWLKNGLAVNAYPRPSYNPTLFDILISGTNEEPEVTGRMLGEELDDNGNLRAKRRTTVTQGYAGYTGESVVG